VQGFGAPVEWRPAVVIGLFVLWAALARSIGALVATLVVLLIGLAIVFRRDLLDWYRTRFHGPG